MFKKKFRVATASILCVFIVIAALSSPVSAATYKEKLTYTNLVDIATQQEVSQQLRVAGVSSDNIESLMENVNYFNQTMGPIPKAKNGYKTVNKLEAGYNEGMAIELWEKNEKYPVPDLNCRLTAFGLLKSNLNTSKGDVEITPFIIPDLETIEDYPLDYFTQNDIANFKNMYGQVNLKKLTTTTASAKAVQRYWKKNGVSFDTGKNVTMVNVFEYFDLDQNLFVGHAGILVKVKEGYLFIEKYGQALPYQVTKVSTKADLYRYLMKRLDRGDGKYKSGAFIMLNDQKLEESQVKQYVQAKTSKKGLVKYSLAKRSDVTISIYSKKGKLISTYKEKSMSPAATHDFQWDGRTKSGKKVPSGIYYAKVKANKVVVRTNGFRIKN